MPHTTTTAVAHIEPPPLTPKEPFPLRSVLLAALIPVLLGAACALFIAPPFFVSDTAHGLIAWFHYLRGGTWNTQPGIDFNNIAQSIEIPVTWWPPGQYALVGILHSIGLSFGGGIILITSCSTLLLGVGLAKLAHTLGVSARMLPLVSLAATFSHHTFSQFSSFIGGEPLSIALWPWTCLIAWKLRKRYLLLTITLPVLFLTGSYIKHSFAICALSILAFLWFDSLRKAIISRADKHDNSKPLLYINFSLFAIGLLYIFTRNIIIPSNGGSPSDLGLYPRSFLVSWGFSFLAPIIQMTGIEKTLGFISFRFFGTPGSEELYPSIGWLFALLSPFPLSLYIRLSIRNNPMERLTGAIALVYCTIMCLLLWGGGSIALRGRYFQPIAVLLIALLAIKCFHINRIYRIGSRIILIVAMSFGVLLLFYRSITISNPHSRYYPVGGGISMVDVPPSILAKLQEIVNLPDSVIFIQEPQLELELISNAPLSTRFFRADIADEWHLSQPKKGRVRRLVLPISPDRAQLGLAETLRKSFVDYNEEEWSLTTIDGWQIWQAEASEQNSVREYEQTET